MTRRVLWRAILAQRQGRGLLLSTHHTDDVETICDRLWFVSDAKIVYNGTYSDLSKRTATTGFHVSVPASSAAGADVLPAPFHGHNRFSNLLATCATIASRRHISTSDLRIRSITANAAIVQMYELLSTASPASNSATFPTRYGAVSDTRHAPSQSQGHSRAGEQERGDDEWLMDSLDQPIAPSAESKILSVYMVWHLLKMRAMELVRTGWLFFITFIVLPAVVALLISAVSATPLKQSLALSYDVLGPSEVFSCPDRFTAGAMAEGSTHTIPDADITPCQYLSSGALLNSMFAEYYHHQLPRWGAFVFDDHIRDFLSSSAAISVESDTELEQRDSDRLHELIENMNRSVTLTSNITILTNVSAPHSLPMFFAAVNNLITGPQQYKLESRPFPVSTCAEICLDRGYKAAALVLVLFFIIPIVSIRMPLQLVNTGSKLQLHLAGVSPTQYWFTHILLDSTAVFVCSYVTYIAALAGGDPVRSFLSPLHAAENGWAGEHIGVLLLAAFSLASVAANFTMCLTPVDPVPMQLTLLVMSVTNGLFVHYFLSLQASSALFAMLDAVLFAVSPFYVLGDAFFTMFALNVQQYSDKPVGILEHYSGGFPRLLLDVRVMIVQAVAYVALTLACETIAPWLNARLRSDERSDMCYGSPFRSPYTPISVTEESAIDAVKLSRYAVRS